ncbi:MAG: hypothetical protein ACI9FN_000165 [Saprospiraceae bacterium]|jgi:hypothetical protein
MIDLKSFKALRQNMSLIVLMILSFLSVIFALLSSKVYLAYNETRAGWDLYDPVIESIGPIDLSTPIFLLTYGCIIIGLICSMTTPKKLIQTNFTILCLLVYRLLCMYLVPLEAPLDIIPLQDAFLMNTTYGNQLLVKDLFFSGHTASVVILFYLVDHKNISKIFLAMSVIIGSMLIMQHVHYTIDVLVAYIFAHISYLSGLWLTNKGLLYSRLFFLRMPKLA